MLVFETWHFSSICTIPCSNFCFRFSLFLCFIDIFHVLPKNCFRQKTWSTVFPVHKIMELLFVLLQTHPQILLGLFTHSMQSRGRGVLWSPWVFEELTLIIRQIINHHVSPFGKILEKFSYRTVSSAFLSLLKKINYMYIIHLKFKFYWKIKHFFPVKGKYFKRIQNNLQILAN